MKLKVMAAMIPALFATSSFAADIEGATSTVKFSGTVETSTCSLVSSSENQEIAMGTVTDQTLSKPGATSSAKDFSVTLENCGAVAKAEDGTPTGVYIKFKGNTAIGEATTLLTNDNGSVGIQIKQGTKLVAMDGSARTDKVDFDASGNATLNFTANYVRIAEELTTGPATAQADFTVYYQ